MHARTPHTRWLQRAFGLGLGLFVLVILLVEPGPDAPSATAAGYATLAERLAGPSDADAKPLSHSDANLLVWLGLLGLALFPYRFRPQDD